MPRTRSVAWSELKLGVVGVVAIVMVATLIVAVGGQGGFWWQRYPLKARFSQVNGLKKGAVVRLNGKEVGKVTIVEFAGAQIDVGIEVSDTVRPLVTTESHATIGSLSLLGEPIIDIQAASRGTPLQDWAYLKTDERAGGPFGELTATASQSLQQAEQLIADVRAGRGTLGKLATDEALYDELQQFAKSAAEVSRSLNQGQGTLGQLAKDPAAYNALKASLDNLQAMTERVNAGQSALGRLLNDDAMGKSLASATSNLEQVTSRLDRGEGTVGKLLRDDTVYNQLNSLTARVDQLMAQLGQGEGTAGQVLHNKALYDNMNAAATELRSLLADIRKDPRKFLQVRVSIF